MIQSNRSYSCLHAKGRRCFRILGITIVVLALCGLAIVTLCYRSVSRHAEERLYERVEDVPVRCVAVVFGTSPKAASGLDSVIFVSQQFHNERALFLAEKNGLDAIGYNARDVKSCFFRTKRFIREHLARVKMYLDIWLGRQPKYLGEPISVG